MRILEKWIDHNNSIDRMKEKQTKNSDYSYKIL